MTPLPAHWAVHDKRTWRGLYCGSEVTEAGLPVAMVYGGSRTEARTRARAALIAAAPALAEAAWEVLLGDEKLGKLELREALQEAGLEP